MKRLYDLNKDELIKIMSNVIKNLSDEELEAELRKRKENKKLMILKRSLLNLKAIPHLTEFVSRHEKFIKSRTRIDDLCYTESEFKRECKEFSLCKYEDREDGDLLIDVISKFSRQGDTWIASNHDNVVYESCEKCDYYAIKFYEGDIVRHKMSRYGTSQLCPDHFRHGYEGYF